MTVFFARETVTKVSSSASSNRNEWPYKLFINVIRLYLPVEDEDSPSEFREIVLLANSLIKLLHLAKSSTPAGSASGEEDPLDIL